MLIPCVVSPVHGLLDIIMHLTDFFEKDGQSVSDVPNITNEIDFGSNPVNKVRLVGVIFGRDDVKLVKEQIIPRINYLHHRSGHNVDFFCVGFSNAGHDFDDAGFVSTLEQFERLLDWRYSGKTDMILLNARYEKATKKAVLGFESAVSITFERAIEDKAIKSVSAFFEDIIAFAKEHEGNDPSWGFSDQQGLRIGGSALKRFLLSLLPEAVRDNTKKAEHHYIRDLRKHE